MGSRLSAPVNVLALPAAADLPSVRVEFSRQEDLRRLVFSVLHEEGLPPRQVSR